MIKNLIKKWLTPKKEEEDYLKLYEELITEAQGREKVEGYTESHHIVPRSDFNNIFDAYRADLTAYEHYLAHYYLHKAFPDSKAYAYSVWRMSNKKEISVEIGAARYAEAREAFSKVNSGSQNPNCSKEIHLFVNIDRQVAELLTQNAMRYKYNLDSGNLSRLCRGKCNTVKGWSTTSYD